MRDLQRRQMGAVNKTLHEATAVMKNFGTPKASLAKIELLVCLTAFLLVLLTVFGSSRRRYNNPKLRMLLWAAYTLSSYLIAYTLGLITEASFRNELLPVWAIFLMIFFGSSDSFSAYSLEDCERRRNYAWQYQIKSLMVLILLIMYGITSPMIWALLVLQSMMDVRFIQRARSLGNAREYGRQRTTKLIADYMSSEHQSSKGDPVQMSGYNYVVREEMAQCPCKAPNYRKSLNAKDDRVVTIEKVWKCQGWLLRSEGGDRDSKLKDICLSLSLYKLLLLRFSGYTLPKQAHEKMWKLIQHLYAKGTGYERAFRIVELELSLLFDFFYTNYPFIFLPRHWITKVQELFLLVIGSLVTVGLCFLLDSSKRPEDEVQLATAGGSSIDVLVTALILIVFTCVELVQFFFVANSDWVKVLLLCKYVQTQSWQGNERIEKLIGLICRMRTRKPWERKLRQYSLLESYDYTPMVWLYNAYTSVYIARVWDGQKQSPPAELFPEVKQAVFRSLMSNPRVLENGEASLRLNKVAGKLSWACRLQTQSQVIMVWHIATSIYEDEWRISDPNLDVATCLSKYLAYLSAFSPKLLPDHPYDAHHIFKYVIIESREVLKGCNEIKERIQKLKEIGSKWEPDGGVIKQGAHLGHQLLTEKKGPKFIWKVLAEFWAELMVYVAPSDDAKAHAEHLAMGGEFVTHLWALVSHAGIKREPPIERPTLNVSQML